MTDASLAASNLDRQWRSYQTWVSACLLLLFVATWPLWVIQDRFPRVPISKSLRSIVLEIPAFENLTYLAMALMCIAILTGLFAFYRRSMLSRLWWLFPVGWLLTSLFDQHRLQPWGYHASLLSLLFATMPAREGRIWGRRLIISIYLYSALGKFDAQFLHTVGPMFLEPFLRWLSIDSTLWPMSTRAGISLLLPSVELIVAVLLIVPKTRTMGCILATGMHGLLIAILSPLGLGHEYGVLIWNALFIGQVWFLFGFSEHRLSGTIDGESHQGITPSMVPLFPRAVFVMAMIWPMGERWGYCDHWFAWALYSPHSSRVEIWVLDEATEKIPMPYREYLDPPIEDPQGLVWRALRIDRWSLAAVHAPIYPQARYQLGVVRQIASEWNLGVDCHVRVLGPAHRITGLRELEFTGNASQLLRL